MLFRRPVKPPYGKCARTPIIYTTETFRWRQVKGVSGNQALKHHENGAVLYWPWTSFIEVMSMKIGAVTRQACQKLDKYVLGKRMARQL